MRNQLRKITLYFETAADYGICIYILLILVMLPFYFTDGYSHIGTDKALFFRAVNVNMGRILIPLAIVVIILELLCVICRKYGNEELRGGNGILSRLSVTDMFMAAYGGSLIISYLLSDYRETALLGAQGWFMGVFTQLAFVLTYFLVSRLWKPRRWLFYVVLPVSAIVFFLGYLDRFGFFVLHMESRTNSFISTIGNINWYCGYAVSVFFWGVTLLWKGEAKKNTQKMLLMLYVLLGFGTLLTQGSESGMAAVGIVMPVLFCLSVGCIGDMLLFWHIMALFSGACLISSLLRLAVKDNFAYVESGAVELATSGSFSAIMAIVSFSALAWIWKQKKAGIYRKRTFRVLAGVLAALCMGSILLVLLLGIINTIHPGSIGKLSAYSLFTFSPAWGNGRGTTWSAGLMCFREQNFLHKLVGVGPDAMSSYIYRDGSEELYTMLMERFGDSVLTNAHNEWLTVLVNEGILGFVSYAGVMLSAMVRFLKKGRQNTFLCAVGLCLLAYTVNNIFSFQQTMNGATIFVLLGMGAAFDRDGPERREYASDKILEGRAVEDYMS